MAAQCCISYCIRVYSVSGVGRLMQHTQLISVKKSRFKPTLLCSYSLFITGSASTVVVVLGGVQADTASVLQINRSAPSLRIVVSPLCV